MKEALINRFGEHRVSEVPVNDGDIPLLMLDLELKSPVTVLMTNGLRNYKMPVPEKFAGRAYNELFFCLPSYWEWEDRDNPNMNWIFDWIQRIAKHVESNNTWYGPGHTFPCGKEEASLSATMKQNYFLLADPNLLEEELKPIKVEDKQVHFLSIIPIFKEEFEHKQARGTFKLLRKMNFNGVTEKLDDFRGSVLKRRWKFNKG